MSPNAESHSNPTFDEIVAMSKDQNLRRKRLMERLPVVDLDWDLCLHGDSDESQEIPPEQAQWQIFVFQCMESMKGLNPDAEYYKLKWSEVPLGHSLLFVPISMHKILGPVGLYPRFWGFLCTYLSEQQHAEAKKVTISLPANLFDGIEDFGDILLDGQADPLKDTEVFMITTSYHGLHEFKIDGEKRQAHSFGDVHILVGKRKLVS